MCFGSIMRVKRLASLAGATSTLVLGINNGARIRHLSAGDGAMGGGVGKAGALPLLGLLGPLCDSLKEEDKFILPSCLQWPLADLCFQFGSFPEEPWAEGCTDSSLSACRAVFKG